MAPKSIREGQDALGVQFLNDVKKRRTDLEEWHGRRKVLEVLGKKKHRQTSDNQPGELSIVFVEDRHVVDKIVDLRDYVAALDELVIPDNYVLELINNTGGAEEAFEKHLDDRPKY